MFENRLVFEANFLFRCNISIRLRVDPQAGELKIGAE